MTGRPGGVAGTNIPNPMILPHSDKFSISPAILSPMEAGYVKSRARFTQIPRTYHVRYEGITTADKDLIYDFEVARNGGSEAFTWRRPDTDKTFSVRFDGEVLYTPWENTNYTRWTVEFDVTSEYAVTST